MYLWCQLSRDRSGSGEELPRGLLMTADPLSVEPTMTPPPGARPAADATDADLSVAATFRGGVPHDAFDALRSQGGVAWHPERPASTLPSGGDFLQFVDSPGFWAVTSHALVTEVLRNATTFSAGLGGVFMFSLTPESLATFRQMMLNMDAPEHTRLRRILQPVFTPKAVQRLHDAVVVNATEITDALIEKGGGDLVPDMSAEMPLRVLADLLGMPREDRHLIFRWSNQMMGFDDPGATGPRDAAYGAFAELMAYGQEIAADRRSSPRDDIVSMIVNAEVDGERLSETEFSMFWLLLVIAGNETTRNALSGAVLALHRQEMWDWLVAHPEALDTAVDELLRYVSPVMHFRRTATVDTVLGDQAVRAGDKVVVWYGAANRDPEVFPDPHRLDLLRDPNPHLAFGVGPHFCLGAHLARLEIRTMFEALLRRAPTLRLTGEVVVSPSNFINGISRLDYSLG
jgi:cytochrome P450